jgi:glycosyltransferase involved in cell wall biosynthesis
MRPKIAIVISHPIQHFCPQYISYALYKDWETKVFFASAIGYKSYYDPNFKKEVSWDNLDITKFNHVFLNGEENIPITNKINAKSLHDELKKYHPDVVVIYGYIQALERNAFRWAIHNKKKIFYISDTEFLQKRNPLKEFIKNLVVKHYFKKIAGFLTVGDSNEESYLKRGVPPYKLFKMHFPIDVVAYEDAYNNKDFLRKNLRETYSINDDEFLCCMVGKLVPWKNQVDIIDALILLEKQDIYLHLFIIGSGPDQEALTKKAKKLNKSKVHFTGFVNVSELPAYYAMCDVYIHAASIEPHSLSISEAIYMGKPIIVSDKCGSIGPADDVIKDKNGLVFKTADIDDLANKISTLYLNKSTCIKFGDTSHHLALAYQKKAHGEAMKEAISYYFK